MDIPFLACARRIARDRVALWRPVRCESLQAFAESLDTFVACVHFDYLR